ncbi:hypothetical protein Tco_1017758 [Tanacetum coccineum]|uniref:Uncharacterized protein n=1 Tax=Tanacetum coccineum TaxID=301880 RepID=A0ABQ5FTT3_9ASTR
MSGEEPAPQMEPVESPQMISTVKLPILKKGEYTLWSMRMEPYLVNTYYGLWQIIMNGIEPVQTTKDDNGVETEVPLKTAQAILARQKERKAKSILLLAIPDEYQLRIPPLSFKSFVFHMFCLINSNIIPNIKDGKSLWAAIKSRFGGNVESKKIARSINSKIMEQLYPNEMHIRNFKELTFHHGTMECRANKKKQVGTRMEMKGKGATDNTRRLYQWRPQTLCSVRTIALIVQDGTVNDWSNKAQD